MPKAKTYTKAQKAAYAKRMAAKKKKPAVVSKQNQFRVEYKDRISAILSNTVTINGGAVNTGPANTAILLPQALIDPFTQGTSNGQVDGNNINLKYLNMKVKLDFTDLPSMVQAAAPPAGTVGQTYNLMVRQVLIKKDMRDFLQASFINPNSKRTQAAFSSVAAAAQGWLDTAKLYTFNSLLKSEFLSYGRREKTDVVVLKTIRVLGEQTKTFQDDSDSTNISPDRHLTFNWNMPKVKQLLSPMSDDGDTMVLSSMWLPAVLVSLERKHMTLYDAGGKTTPPTPLLITHISHLTYTDS